jgi:hypothetical protein
VIIKHTNPTIKAGVYLMNFISFISFFDNMGGYYLLFIKNKINILFIIFIFISI